MLTLKYRHPKDLWCLRRRGKVDRKRLLARKVTKNGRQSFGKSSSFRRIASNRLKYLSSFKAERDRLALDIPDIPFNFEVKTDSVQSSCKNYLLKIYSQNGNFLNAISNISLQFSSLSDPAMKSPSILEKFNVKLRKNAKSECYCVFN